MNRFCLSILCLFTMALCTGCGTGSATLWVDNDSDEALQIDIDGKQELFVSARDYAKCRIPFGEHHVMVYNRHQKVVMDEMKTFEPHQDGLGWRHYLLDPAGDTKYKVQEIYYYHDKEQAKKGKRSSFVKRLARQKWVDVPNGAVALVALPGVFVSAEKKVTGRLCVIPDKK